MKGAAREHMMFVEGGDPLDVPIESLAMVPASDPEHREGECLDWAVRPPEPLVPPAPVCPQACPCVPLCAPRPDPARVPPVPVCPQA